MTTDELTEKIEQCNSKQAVLMLGSYIANNPDFIDHILLLMREMNKPKHWKAAWVFDHVYQEDKGLILPYIDTLITLFKESKSQSVLRICGKLLTFHPVTDKLDGDFINVCFDMLISPNVAVAIKVHAMQLVFNISEVYPELKPELKIVIQEQIPNNTAGFKSRANKLLKKL